MQHSCYFINLICMKIVLLVLTLLMSSCFTKTYNNYCIQKVYGWIPVFEVNTSYKVITTTANRVTTNAGKIYVYGNYILQVESGEGIHVIDNSDPKMPVKKGFIQIKACAEVEMKDGYLYTNNFNDLVTLKYSFTNNTVQEISRIPNTFQNLEINYQLAQPPMPGFYRCNYAKDSVVKNWYQDSIIQCESCYKN